MHTFCRLAIHQLGLAHRTILRLDGSVDLDRMAGIRSNTRPTVPSHGTPDSDRGLSNNHPNHRMKIQTTSILAALAGLSFAAGSANAATLASNITNGDFTATTSDDASTDAVLLSSLTTDQWNFHKGGTALIWSIAGGVASYDATTNDPRTKLISQVIDGTGTTGIINLNFDIEIGSIAGNNDTDMGVYLFGWDDTDIAPSVDHGLSDGFGLNSIGAINGATSLLGASPYVIFENGTISTDALAQGVNTAAGFDSVSLSADFGTGYDNVAVLFSVSFDRADTASNLEIDNVAFDIVPEPSSLALLGLGGLALILRRRK